MGVESWNMMGEEEEAPKRQGGSRTKKKSPRRARGEIPQGTARAVGRASGVKGATSLLSKGTGLAAGLIPFLTSNPWGLGAAALLTLLSAPQILQEFGILESPEEREAEKERRNRRAGTLGAAMMMAEDDARTERAQARASQERIFSRISQANAANALGDIGMIGNFARGMGGSVGPSGISEQEMAARIAAVQQAIPNLGATDLMTQAGLY